MHDLEACKVGDDLYLCSQCGAEVKSNHFYKHYSICRDCEEENGSRYDDDDDDDYYDEDRDDD